MADDDDLKRFKTFVDRERSACLCDAGLVGYSIALCVNVDGEDQAWLVDEAMLGAPKTPHGDANQPHEQLGPLPASWRRRVAFAPYRCGRPRTDGRPCRQLVGVPGRSCAWHSENADAP